MERIKQQVSQRTPVPTNRFPPPAAETNPTRLVVRQKEKLVFLDTQDIVFITRKYRNTIIFTGQ